MSRFKIILLEHGYGSVAAERSCVEASGGVFVDCDKRPAAEALAACHDADGVLVRRMDLNRAVLTEHFRNVKVVVRYGVGVDNIDLAAATDLGIIVSRVPDYGFEEVSDHAIALILAGARDIVGRCAVMRGGGWDVQRTTRIERFGKQTVGLLGLGQIGRCVAHKLGGWDMRLIACDPYIEPEVFARAGVEAVDWATLMAEADYLSLHAPLLPETKHIINAESLERMKSTAFLVNTARGGLVDTAALLKALDAGRIAGAGLDVFEQEPPAVDDPVRRHDKVILTDHTAWYSETSQQQLQLSVAQEVVRGASGGLPRTIANPEVLDKLGRAAEWPGDAASGWMARRREIFGLLPTASGLPAKV